MPLDFEECERRAAGLRGRAWLQPRTGCPIEGSQAFNHQGTRAAREVFEVLLRPELQMDHVDNATPVCICARCLVKKWALRFGSSKVKRFLLTLK